MRNGAVILFSGGFGMRVSVGRRHGPRLAQARLRGRGEPRAAGAFKVSPAACHSSRPGALLASGASQGTAQG
eukprot:997757-Rhodomonas_salina.3